MELQREEEERRREAEKNQEEGDFGDEDAYAAPRPAEWQGDIGDPGKIIFIIISALRNTDALLSPRMITFAVIRYSLVTPTVPVVWINLGLTYRNLDKLISRNTNDHERC
jgi:hypothetical protein